MAPPGGPGGRAGGRSYNNVLIFDHVDVAMMLVSGDFFVLPLPPVILVTPRDGNLAEARLPFS